MSTSATLLTAGLACIIAAIIGGGLKAFGVEFPALRSGRRQALLAGFGIVLIASLWVVHASGAPAAAAREVLLFDSSNDQGTLNGPTRPAEFETTRSFHITSIWTYHWNDEFGALPGSIGLRDANSVLFGPWEANENGPGRQRDWLCKPNIILPPGRYTIVDSEPSTWSWNPRNQAGVGSDGVGMSKVRGIPAEGWLDTVWHRLGL